MGDQWRQRKMGTALMAARGPTGSGPASLGQPWPKDAKIHSNVRMVGAQREQAVVGGRDQDGRPGFGVTQPATEEQRAGPAADGRDGSTTGEQRGNAAHRARPCEVTAYPGRARAKVDEHEF
jgi:hypothetical protein